MIFSEDKLKVLREEIKKYISDKRYIHTLGVEETASYIADFCLPDSKSELCAAALLHDIAKEYTTEEQLKFIKAIDYPLNKDDILSPQILHSFAARYVILNDFKTFATSNILSSVEKHTVGGIEMSVFDEIIFISDYIEPSRSYEDCIFVRDYLKQSLIDKNAINENLASLHKAVNLCIDKTVEHLKKKNKNVNPRTIELKKQISKLIKQDKNYE